MFEFLGANFAFKKSLFEECGLFRTDIGPGKKVLGEDTEITNRLLQAGKRLYYCGKALVWHPVEPQRMTVKYITSWYIALGRYRIIISQQTMPSQDKTYWGISGQLIWRLMAEAKYLLTHVFNRRELLRAWVDVCVTYGKISQMRKTRKNQGKTLCL
jgi:GT2 family glycosyltransferase